ncbi:hypothetical protein BDN72DRAFT_961392 [Pluteus cervinus]|uniref:Uncharacterized protein n=1 Tax=Pluteus cervinus TaxID=181527 RepID=A0ACD3AMW3_9AGAR|nr:hypothetical protein BDN72DRAFT_961392 [Pluteus cervinus]
MPPRSVRVRPTHFLALPLHNHPTLRTRVASFQNALLAQSPGVPGLDKSIVIDPRRMHFTLGVMALELEGPQSTTVEDALRLLESIQPQISEDIGVGLGGVDVELDEMDVFNFDKVKGDENGVYANVLFVGPSRDAKRKEGGKRLIKLTDLVHQTFKQAGYVTDPRPLKLHCTLLNTSHRRRPSPRQAFRYTSILESPACSLLFTPPDSPSPSTTTTTSTHPTTSPTTTTHPSTSSTSLPTAALPTAALPTSALPTTALSTHPPKPIPIHLGTFNISSIELWKMGSHGENNEYVSCGGISFG